MSNAEQNRYRAMKFVAVVLVLAATLSSAGYGQAAPPAQPAQQAQPTGQQQQPPAQQPQAQEGTQSPAPPTPSAPAGSVAEGIESHGYEVKQTFEFGGRIASTNGNQGLYATYVNLDSGPRLLEQTLDMHSAAHTGVLFDDLTLTSFGFGGDPNNVARLTLGKGRLYDFNASYRRNEHFWDYNLFANPLNPSNSNPNVPVLSSPHLLNLVRHMTDLSLNLLPVSRVRFRLAYTHDSNEGPSFSTVHEGTEGLLNQPWRDTTDTYQAGISFRPFARTNLNYDQFLTHYKGDTSWQLTGFNGALANGTPVSLGIVFNTPAAQPCAVPFVAGGAANATCNLYTGYSRVSPARTDFPTEQLSFQSNYFKRIDLSGRGTYTGADSVMPVYQEVLGGFVSRTRTVSQTQTELNRARARRISGSADFGATFHASERLRFVDTFRWINFRIPGGETFLTNSLFAASAAIAPNTFNPATCPATPATCPQHIAASSADVETDVFGNFLKQDRKMNTFEIEYDFTRKFGGRIGYRFDRRNIFLSSSETSAFTFYPTLPNRGACATQPATTGPCSVTTTTADSDDVQINENSGLIGFWARPMNGWRISFDTELSSADNVFTRIMPRHQQWYRLRSVYKPMEWLSVGANVNIQERRNTSLDIDNHQHNRSYSLNASLSRWQHFGVDLSYSYDDVFSAINICFVATPTPATALTCGTPFLSGISLYKDLEHFGSATFMLKPVPRVTTTFGYTITSANGSTLILNPNAPLGPVDFNYHLPAASIAVELNKHLIWRGGWNYYDYNEKSAPGPTLPRDFTSNVVTLSLRYVM